MNGYDFDRTIYDGDSSTDFFIYMLLHRPYLLIFLPYFLVVLILYAVKLVGKKRVKELLFFFVPWHKNIDKIVNKFWQKNANRIFDWYSDCDPIYTFCIPAVFIYPANRLCHFCKLGLRRLYQKEKSKQKYQTGSCALFSAEHMDTHRNVSCVVCLSWGHERLRKPEILSNSWLHFLQPPIAILLFIRYSMERSTEWVQN